MSATIDASLFSNYFSQKLSVDIRMANGEKIRNTPTPIIQVESCAYKVQEFYWEDLTEPNSIVAQTLDEYYRHKYAQQKNLNGYVELDSLLDFKKRSYRQVFFFKYLYL
jgi:HrpA-like RNA helicase